MSITIYFNTRNNLAILLKKAENNTNLLNTQFDKINKLTYNDYKTKNNIIKQFLIKIKQRIEYYIKLVEHINKEKNKIILFEKKNNIII